MLSNAIIKRTNTVILISCLHVLYCSNVETSEGPTVKCE